MKTIYLIGPTQTKEGSNAIAFQAIKTKLELLNYKVFTPFNVSDSIIRNELQKDDQRTMAKRIKLLVDCDRAITLENWHEDKASRLEVHISREMNIPVDHFSAIQNLEGCSQ